MLFEIRDSEPTTTTNYLAAVLVHKIAILKSSSSGGLATSSVLSIIFLSKPIPQYSLNLPVIVPLT